MHRLAPYLVLVLALVAGCERNTPAASPAQSAAAATGAESTPSTEPATDDTPATPDVDVLRATGLDALRANHPVSREGSACSVDDDCTSPLRCIEAECIFPAAMTGDIDDTTPIAVFHPAVGEAHTYYLELALSRDEQMRGLMHRRTMAEGFGMLFVFDRDRPRSFWMHDTLIALDIVYIDAAGHIVSAAENAVPLDETGLPSAGPAKYVIELVAGEFEGMGLAPGDRVELMNLPPALRSQGTE